MLLLKPIFVPHADDQGFVLKQLRTQIGPGIVIINKDWPLLAKLWMTDLSPLTTFFETLTRIGVLNLEIQHLCFDPFSCSF